MPDETPDVVPNFVEIDTPWWTEGWHHEHPEFLDERPLNKPTDREGGKTR